MGHVVHDPVDSDREECWRKDTVLPHSRYGLESTGQILATTYLGPCVLVQCHYEVQEDVWDSLAPHSLPRCSPVDRISSPSGTKIALLETRDSRLSYGEDPESLSHLGLVHHRVVTDRRTDGQTESA